MPEGEMVKVLLRGKEPDEVEVMWATPVSGHIISAGDGRAYGIG
jgi:hypothetical protein